MSYRRQYLSVFLALTIYLLDGCQIGWLSPTISKLKDAKSSPLGRAATDEEISTLGVVSSTYVFGLCFSGFISTYIGRKKVFFITATLFILAGLLTAFTADFRILAISRLLASQTIGISAPSVINYLTEITSVKIRGIALGSCSLMINFGILLMFTIGPFCSYETTAFLMTGTAIFVFICLCFIAESPVYLYRKGHKKEALKSLTYLKLSMEQISSAEELKSMLEHNNRQHAEISATDNVPMAELNLNLNIEDANIKPNENKNHLRNGSLNGVAYKNKILKNDNWSIIKDLLMIKSNRKSLILACLVSFAQQVSGISPVLSFASRIFEKSGSAVPPDIAAIILGVIQLFSIACGNVAINTIGRRPLTLWSCGATAFSNFVLGLNLYLEHIKSPAMQYLTWLPLANTLFFIFSYCVGLGTVLLTLTGELFDTSVRPLGAPFTLIFNNLLSVAIMTFYVMVSLKFGEHWTFWAFSVCGLTSLVILSYHLPETKDKRFSEIQDEMK